MSPVGVSLTEPVTLNGPPNSFCSALKVRSHLSSVLEMSAPIDTIVSVGRTLKRSAWLLPQPWFCAPPLGRLRDIETPFSSVTDTSSPTGTERLSLVPSWVCSYAGSTRVSIAVWSQPSAEPKPSAESKSGAVTVAHATPADWSGTAPAVSCSGWKLVAGIEGLW